MSKRSCVKESYNPDDFRSSHSDDDPQRRKRRKCYKKLMTTKFRKQTDGETSDGHLSPVKAKSKSKSKSKKRKRSKVLSSDAGVSGEQPRGKHKSKVRHLVSSTSGSEGEALTKDIVASVTGGPALPDTDIATGGTGEQTCSPPHLPDTDIATGGTGGQTSPDTNPAAQCVNDEAIAAELEIQFNNSTADVSDNHSNIEHASVDELEKMHTSDDADIAVQGEANVEGDTNVEPNGDTNGDANGDANVEPNVEADANDDANGDANGDANVEPNGEPNVEPNGEPNVGGDANGEGDASVEGDASAEGDPNDQNDIDLSMNIVDDEADMNDLDDLDYPLRGETDTDTGDEGEGDGGDGNWYDATPADAELFVIPDFDKTVGPTFTLSNAAIEVDYFYQFMPRDLIWLAMDETNKYAQYHQLNIAKSTNKYWKPTCIEEMSAFIGLLIAMGLDQKPGIEDYWSTEPFLTNPGIVKVMTRNRFQLLYRYFHLADAVGDPKRIVNAEARQLAIVADPLYKVNPWLKPILLNCQTKYQMGQDISIDEGMVAFKGRSVFKQRLPHKPDKDGFKVWELCDSKTSYVSNFEPYLGIKFLNNREGRRAEKGTIHRTVLRLMQPFNECNHILFCDSLFTRMETAMRLAEKKTYIVGSYSRRNRKDMPPQLIPPGRQKKLKLDTGEKIAVTRVVNDQPVNITAYQDDSAQILILNTVYPPDETVETQGRNGERDVPLSLHHYRTGMGGVDRANQKRKYYHVGRRNRRWWTYLSNFLIDVSLVNAYECYKFAKPDTKVSHKTFNLRVAKQLVAGYTSRKVVTQRQVTKTITESSAIDAANIGQHQVVTFKGRQKTCKYCSMVGKKTPRNRTPETTSGCETCDVNLHKGECFIKFHHRLIYTNKKDAQTQTTTTNPPGTSPVVRRTRQVATENQTRNAPVAPSSNAAPRASAELEPQPSTSGEQSQRGRKKTRGTRKRPDSISPHPAQTRRSNGRGRGRGRGKDKGKK